MTQEEKLEEAKRLYKTANADQRYVLESLFPELKEPEDEKIRKYPIDVVNDYCKGSEHDGCIAWLEKQGEQKPVFEIKTPEESLGINSDTYNKIVDECIYCEQKSTDKVEPFDKYEGLTDFERTLADICIGWIGEELGWKQYIKDNADVLLKIAIKKFNSSQDVAFEQKPAELSQSEVTKTSDQVQKPAEWSLPYGKNETAEDLIALAECLETEGDCLFNRLTGDEYGKLLRELAKEIKSKHAEEVRDPYERCVQYQSVEAGIKAHAEIYSFNIDSKLFPQLTKEQQKLWRKEIEYACISGGDMGYILAKDPRYKENHEVKETNLEEYINELSKQFPDVSFAKLSRIAVRVAKWQKENLWKPADGDELPEYEREVVVLHQPYPLEGSEYAVGFAHRPDPKGWDGTNIATGKTEHYTPKTYDKGGWNIHNIKWFLDLELPVEVEKFI